MYAHEIFELKRSDLICLHPIHVCRSVFDKVYITSTHQKLSKFGHEHQFGGVKCYYTHVECAHDMKTGARQQKVKDTVHIYIQLWLVKSRQIRNSIIGLESWGCGRNKSVIWRWWEKTDDEIVTHFLSSALSPRARSRACWPIYYRIRPKKCLIYYIGVRARS